MSELWSPAMRKWAKDARQHGLDLHLAKTRPSRLDRMLAGGAGGVPYLDRVADDAGLRLIDGPSVPITSTNTLFKEFGAASGSPTSAATTGAPAGSGVILAIETVTGTGSATSIVDSAGNTYTQVVSLFGLNAIWYNGKITNPIVAGSTTFTAVTSDASDYSIDIALSTNNQILVSDVGILFPETTTTTVNLSSGVLSFPGELIVVYTTWASAPGSYTESNGFTTVNNNFGIGVIVSTALVRNQGPVFFNPRWTPASGVSIAMVSFAGVSTNPVDAKRRIDVPAL